ncbi:hypothetical protein ACFQS1_13065 [Paractinoplanes rhizophilus]|jgi:hypothetical protein|uniref:YhhN-like protein n=1 Tax=Paractinoplanes rhizophilus TaxID=1416877 RepID=A0ABW2HQZ6_9ACTN|nr:hypothetical protein [Actinoplanes sp.]
MTAGIQRHPATRGPWSPAARIALAAAGVVSAALILLDQGATARLPEVLAAAALIYAGTAAAGSARAAWPLFAVTCVVIGISRFAGGDPVATLVLLVPGAAALVWAALRGGRTGLVLQGAGLAFFALIALAGLPGAGWGAGIVAAGLLLHAAWDLAHLRLGRVVPPSYALFCLVLDLALGVAVLVALARS